MFRDPLPPSALLKCTKTGWKVIRKLRIKHAKRKMKRRNQPYPRRELPYFVMRKRGLVLALAGWPIYRRPAIEYQLLR